jgi:aldehyde dehydrogenase (NAD+)
MQEEIFGPVVIINTFRTESEVIEISNKTEYGLMAGVFTQDINCALRVASAFESGMVGVNCISQMFSGTPFGGTKQSGLGRECRREESLAFTDNKTIMVNLDY